MARNLRCPLCGHFEMGAKNTTTLASGNTRRTRECTNCGERFLTEEVAVVEGSYRYKLKIQHKTRGGHVHWRLFVCPDDCITWAQAGNGAFRLEEWEQFAKKMLNAGIQLEEKGQYGTRRD